MAYLFHDLPIKTGKQLQLKAAVQHGKFKYTYKELTDTIQKMANGLIAKGINKGDRIAIFLPKCWPTVISFFAITKAGGIFVPIHPSLKPSQVCHIITDCGASYLITSAQRASQVNADLANCPTLTTLIITDDEINIQNDKFQLDNNFAHIYRWQELLSIDTPQIEPKLIDFDIAAIIYTSGSTGMPKGVILSHRNLVAGTQSVCTYLELQQSDRLLAILPFSFDYGLNQLTSTLSVGGCIVLTEYLLVQDLIRIITKEEITGLAAIPTIWNQLALQSWPPIATQTLRFITNSGGALPVPTITQLSQQLPNTKIILMYGFTEAFRSTYLPFEELQKRPNSIGMAVPNASILVVRKDGSQCDPNEPGELVHRGAFVAMGYWNNQTASAACFRALATQPAKLVQPEICAWSGDIVRQDEQGFLYYVGRKDDMIKTSGYRVSPTEIEQAIRSIVAAQEVAAFGIADQMLGQAVIVALLLPDSKTDNLDINTIMLQLKHELPTFMLPQRIYTRTDFPKTPNGKVDRNMLASEYLDDIERNRSPATTTTTI